MRQAHLFVHLFLISCGICAVKAQSDDSSFIKGPRLIWIDRNSFGISSRIVNVEGNGTELWNKLDKSSITMISQLLHEPSPSSKVAIDYDYDDHYIFWTDPGYKMVKKAMLTSKGNITGVFHGTSNYVEGIAVDWLNNKVYWTDAAYNWIMVSDYDGTYYHCVVDTGLDKPRGIAVNPLTGYLFWSDWGKVAKIEMATLSGKDRVVLIDETTHGAIIGLPNGLTIDYEENSLYWADSSNDNLYSVKLDGVNGSIPHNRIRLVGTADTFGHFFDIDLDSNYFFISDWGNSAIDIVPRNNLDQTKYLRPGGMFKPYGVIMYDEDQQPKQLNVSCKVNNGGCSHMCLGDPTGYKCKCSIGYMLADDGHTCKNQTSHIPLMQLFFADSDGICVLPANVADIAISDTQPYNYNCFLNVSVSTFDYDTYKEKLFYFDKVQQCIMKFSLVDGGAPVKVIKAENVTGIAVDWVSSNIYWTDIGKQEIGVSKLDGTYKYIVLQENVDKPTAIVTYPQKGLLYWANSGANPRIEKVGMSGRNPESFVSKDIVEPIALTIDFVNERLYWADGGLGTVEYISLTGGNRRPLLNSQTDHSYRGITAYQDYFYVSEQNNEWIVILNKEEKKHTRSLKVEGLGAIKFYDKSLQPMEEVQSGGACDIDNGGCEELCLPSPDGPDCFCQEENDETGKVCQPVLRCPTSFLHGHVTEDCDNTYGKTCGFVCDENFIPTTDELEPLECQWDGLWNSKIHKDKLCALNSSLDHFILVADTHQIMLIDVISDGVYNFIPLPIQEVVNPVAIDFDFVEEKLYWTDANQRKIYRANVDGSNKEIIAEDVQVPDGLALDFVDQRVYWTDAGSEKRIERSYLNGTDREVIIGDQLEKPRAIMIDGTNEYMYWTDWDPKGATINRAKLNGTDREVLVNTGLTWPNGLVIDLYTNKLFWCDASHNIIESSNLDGSNRKVLINLGESAHPFGLTLEGNNLYWTDWVEKHVMTANKFTGGKIHSIGQGYFNKPNDLHVYNRNGLIKGTLPPTSTKQGPTTEKVKTSTTDSSLITNPRKAPTSSDIGKTTELPASSKPTKAANNTGTPGPHFANSHSLVLLPVFIVVVVIVCIVVILIIYLRKRHKTPSLPARMKFDRPVYKNLTEETDSVLAYYRDDEAELANSQTGSTQQSNGTAPPQLGQYSRLQFDNGNEYVTFSQ